jgi:predicted permease
VVVLSAGFWRRRFGADPQTVGRVVSLNGRPYTIVGVGPTGFTGLLRGVSPDLFVPLAMQDALGGGALEERGNRGLMLVGRLRPGLGVEQVRADLDRIASRLHAAHPQAWTNRLGTRREVSVLAEGASRLPPQAAAPVSAFLALLSAGVGLVLVVACSNVAGMLLARARARRREVAIRVALGARRGHLVRQLMIESLLLSLGAGALGVLLAAWAVRLIVAFQPPLPVTLALGLGLDGRVLLFSALVSMLTALAFGLLPALHASRPDPMEALKTAGGDAPARRRRVALRDALVASQVAVCLVLLVGAGLFLRSLAAARRIQPGFDPRGVLAFALDLGAQGLAEAQGRAFLTQLRERLSALPGVEEVSLASRVPLSLGGGRRGLEIEGYAPGPGEDMEVHYSVVGPGYFRTMRSPLARGRDLTEADAGGPGVVVVNEAFVRRYWPGQSGLGRRVLVPRSVAGRDEQAPMEVVGVARDGKYDTLGEEPTPFVFYAHGPLYEAEVSVLLRASGSPAALAGAVRREVAAFDPTLPVFDVKTLEQHLGTALFPVRAAATVLGLMGALALVLAAVGLYGVLAYAVTRRTREIGVRMALGAHRADVVAMVLRGGLRLTAAGAAVGLVAAVAVTRFLAFLLYGVSPLDPLTLAGVVALLASVALLAAVVPARRAAAVEPMAALREE